MQQALEAAKNVPAERQDLLAAELMERLRLLEQPPTQLSAEERAHLELALAAAQRGEFASDAEVAAIIKHPDQHKEGDFTEILRRAQDLSIERHRIAHGHVTMWGEFKMPEGLEREQNSA